MAAEWHHFKRIDHGSLPSQKKVRWRRPIALMQKRQKLSSLMPVPNRSMTRDVGTKRPIPIGGITEPSGGRHYFGALMLGVYDKGRLQYVGHTGTGLSEALIT
jgi:hypothetical protein